jgi:hypothetical protein
MTLSIQEISDRLEITDAIVRYSHGLDRRLWEEWDRAFTNDAIIDFTAFGLFSGPTHEFRKLFTGNDASRISGQHLVSNLLISLDGDRATAYAEFSLVTLSKVDSPGKARRARAGGWYEDELVRTPDGWRIRVRRGFPKSSEVDEIPWSGDTPSA